MTNMPWDVPELEGWNIVGMNHYHVDGVRHLFVAMKKNNWCIQAEGPNEEDVFTSLVCWAEAIKERE